MAGGRKKARDQETALALRGARCAGLDDAWLCNLLRKRECNESTVLIAETDDPVREDQVLHFFLSRGEREKAPVFRLDPWLGLRSYDRDKQGFFPIGPDAPAQEKPSASTSSPPFVDIADALRSIDTALKRERATLILDGMDSPLEGHREAQVCFALRSWGFDPALLGNGSTVVLITGNPVRVIDCDTAALLAWERAPLATPVERRHLIEYQASLLGVETDGSVSTLVTITSGLNLHQLESSLLESWHCLRQFDGGTIKRAKAEIIRRSGIVEVQEPDPRGFGAIGGYNAVKRYIVDSVVRPLENQERARKFGADLPRGLLLFGPPGTGKTIFAKALAHEVNIPFIRLRMEDLYSKYLGESGRMFAAAIKVVEQMSPAIVFVDEIDRFGKRAGEDTDGASQETRRVFGQVLEWLGNEERKSIVVGTTNVPQHLDEAFTRPGRLDRIVPLLYPNAQARREIIEIHLGLTGAKSPVPWGMDEESRDRVLTRLATATAGFTGAEIEDLCRRARGVAFLSDREGMVEADLQTAFTNIRINKEEREKRYAHYLALAEQYTNDVTFLTQLEVDR